MPLVIKSQSNSKTTATHYLPSPRHHRTLTHSTILRFQRPHSREHTVQYNVLHNYTYDFFKLLTIACIL